MAFSWLSSRSASPLTGRKGLLVSEGSWCGHSTLALRAEVKPSLPGGLAGARRQACSLSKKTSLSENRA